jgi:hypothetical protein
MFHDLSDPFLMCQSSISVVHIGCMAGNWKEPHFLDAFVHHENAIQQHDVWFKQGEDGKHLFGTHSTVLYKIDSTRGWPTASWKNVGE